MVTKSTNRDVAAKHGEEQQRGTQQRRAEPADHSHYIKQTAGARSMLPDGWPVSPKRVALEEDPLVYPGIEISPIDDDDPIRIFGAVLERPLIPPPVTKARWEDLQTWTALHALTSIGAARNPLGVSTGERPDRHLVHGERSWPTELTQLTVDHLKRQDLAQVRAFGRRLRLRIQSRASEYEHLQGRVATITKTRDGGLPKDDRVLLADLETALLEDKGFVGEGQDLTNGLPSNLGNRGFYGVYGPFDLTVQKLPGNNEIAISASCQIPVRRSEAIEALANRIAKKDKEHNEILIVTCGVPDEYGYACVADHALFQFLWESRNSGIDIIPDKPKHLRGILIHSLDSPRLLHWQASDDVPW